MRLLLLFEVLHWTSASYLSEQEVMSTVQKLLSDDRYNKKKRPQNADGDPLSVTTSVYIHAFNEIDQNDFFYEVTLHMR